jgi:hypothetical protein
LHSYFRFKQVFKTEYKAIRHEAPSKTGGQDIAGGGVANASGRARRERPQNVRISDRVGAGVVGSVMSTDQVGQTGHRADKAEWPNLTLIGQASRP